MKLKGYFLFRFLLVFSMAFFIPLGLMLIDYGATFKDIQGIVGQSLFFGEVNPRVVYHMGFLSILFSYMVLASLCAYWLAMEEKYEK